jgi:hypothetical protein
MSALTVRSEDIIPGESHRINVHTLTRQTDSSERCLKRSYLFVLRPRATERTGEKR